MIAGIYSRITGFEDGWVFVIFIALYLHSSLRCWLIGPRGGRQRKIIKNNPLWIVGALENLIYH